MNIIEFAEHYLKLKLTEYQKELLWAYYNNNFVCMPPRSGKTMIAKIITEYKRGARTD